MRALADTPVFEQSRNERKKVEMAFAHMKRILRLDRLRLRGPARGKGRSSACRNRSELEKNGQSDLETAKRRGSCACIRHCHGN